MDPTTIVRIPVVKSNESVEISINEFEEDCTVILDVLKDEIPPLKIWITCAMVFYRLQKYDHFETVLLEAKACDIFNRSSSAERATVLAALASYKLLVLEQESDPQRRKMLIAEAKDLAKISFNTNHDDPNVASILGLTFVHERDFTGALKHFENARRKAPSHIPAMLGEAFCNYQQGRYKEAFILFRDVATIQAEPSSELISAIGMCHIQLHNYENARLAFVRALEMSPSNSHAHAALGVLHLTTKPKGYMGSALLEFKQAYKILPFNTLALNNISNHFFYKWYADGNPTHLEKAFVMASNALVLTRSKMIEAQSLYMIARCRHAQERYDEARFCYSKALECLPDFDLASYGLGQTLLKADQLGQAQKIFEKLLEKNIDNYDVMKMLYSIYLLTPNLRAQALKLLTKFTKLFPDDYESHIELANALECSDPKLSLEAYEKAFQIKNSLLEEIPYQLLNNIGTMHFVVGKSKKYHGRMEDLTKMRETAEKKDIMTPQDHFHKAVFYFDEAIKTQQLEPYHISNVTMQFNKARVYEELNEDNIALEIYDTILETHPSYIDCILRKALMEKKKKRFVHSLELCQKAISISPRNEMALSLEGYVCLERDDLRNARRIFGQLREKLGRSDQYTLVGLGNVNYALAHGPEKPKIFKDALSYYTSAFKASPSNIYAANGVGLIYAEQHSLEAAKEIFQIVRLHSTDASDPSINLAHIHILQGAPDSAIPLYQSVLSRYSDFGDLNVMCFLGRAYFDAGQYGEAEKLLVKMLHIKPGHLLFSYNLATTQVKYANELLQGPKSTEAGRKITKLLNSAIRIYNRLTKISDTQGLYNPATVKEDMKSCEKVLKFSVERFLKTAENEERIVLEQKQKVRAELEKKEQLRKEEEEKRKQEEDSKRQEISMRAEDLRQKVIMQNQSYIEAMSFEVEKKKKKLRGKSSPQGDDQEDNEDRGSGAGSDREYDEANSGDEMQEENEEEEQEPASEQEEDASEQSAQLTDDEKESQGSQKDAPDDGDVDEQKSSDGEHDRTESREESRKKNRKDKKEKKEKRSRDKDRKEKKRKHKTSRDEEVSDTPAFEGDISDAQKRQIQELRQKRLMSSSRKAEDEEKSRKERRRSDAAKAEKKASRVERSDSDEGEIDETQDVAPSQTEESAEPKKRMRLVSQQPKSQEDIDEDIEDLD
eukprot:TRINITY_DN2320_c0_g1_i2.p1 TRINITY_DN2320_c0_g1~~TRINITY_DN2320_c0_g1_i2.p1  ORF type:complete len:1176 (-),score=274.00 TRINITY_DN2320_c0_g1_i2:298-3825(-)